MIWLKKSGFFELEVVLDLIEMYEKFSENCEKSKSLFEQYKTPPAEYISLINTQNKTLYLNEKYTQISFMTVPLFSKKIGKLTSRKHQQKNNNKYINYHYKDEKLIYSEHYIDADLGSIISFYKKLENTGFIIKYVLKDGIFQLYELEEAEFNSKGKLETATTYTMNFMPRKATIFSEFNEYENGKPRSTVTFSDYTYPTIIFSDIYNSYDYIKTVEKSKVFPVVNPYIFRYSYQYDERNYINKCIVERACFNEKLSLRFSEFVRVDEFEVCGGLGDKNFRYDRDLENYPYI
jgi:hypothetical protein